MLTQGLAMLAKYAWIAVSVSAFLGCRIATSDTPNAHKSAESLVQDSVVRIVKNYDFRSLSGSWKQEGIEFEALTQGGGQALVFGAQCDHLLTARHVIAGWSSDWVDINRTPTIEAAYFDSGVSIEVVNREFKAYPTIVSLDFPSRNDAPGLHRDADDAAIVKLSESLMIDCVPSIDRNARVGVGDKVMFYAYEPGTNDLSSMPFEVTHVARGGVAQAAFLEAPGKDYVIKKGMSGAPIALVRKDGSLAVVGPATTAGAEVADAEGNCAAAAPAPRATREPQKHLEENTSPEALEFLQETMAKHKRVEFLSWPSLVPLNNVDSGWESLAMHWFTPIQSPSTATAPRSGTLETLAAREAAEGFAFEASTIVISADLQFKMGSGVLARSFSGSFLLFSHSYQKKGRRLFGETEFLIKLNNGLENRRNRWLMMRMPDELDESGRAVTVYASRPEVIGLYNQTFPSEIPQRFLPDDSHEVTLRISHDQHAELTIRPIANSKPMLRATSELRRVETEGPAKDRWDFALQP